MNHYERKDEIYMLHEKLDLELRSLLAINDFIHSDPKKEYAEYHRAHIDLVKQYALILNRKLGYRLDEHKLAYIAYAHDILKEHGLTETTREYKGISIPTSTTLYVRNNLDTLEKFNMDEYFNSSAQYHALAGGIFLYKEFGIKDPEILYPVMFHSCPIMEVYQSLPIQTTRYIDIILLADKLSSNYLKINWRETEVLMDLEQAVFGLTGNELHFNFGLHCTRLIAGKDGEEESKKTTEYYLNRLLENEPWINPKKLNIGGNKIWPKRKSPLLKTPY